MQHYALGVPKQDSIINPCHFLALIKSYIQAKKPQKQKTNKTNDPFLRKTMNRLTEREMDGRPEKDTHTEGQS